MNGYVKYFDNNNKYMNFLVYDKEILKHYKKIWDKIKALFKKEFDNEPVYNDKISLYNINFYGNKIPKENECCTCNIIRFYFC